MLYTGVTVIMHTTYMRYYSDIDLEEVATADRTMSDSEHLIFKT